MTIQKLGARHLMEFQSMVSHRLKKKIKEADVKTAILTVPSVKSQEVANLWLMQV